MEPADAGYNYQTAYDYDAVNRLLWAREAQTADPTAEVWKQHFTHADAAGQSAQFGNRRVDPAHTTPNALPQQNPTINPANNRFAVNQGYSYHDAGSLTAEPGGRTYSYDAENRLTMVDGGLSSGAGAEYSHDGDGRRVRKATSAETTLFIYDAMGRLVAEYSNQSAGTGTSYLTQDHHRRTLRKVLKVSSDDAVLCCRFQESDIQTGGLDYSFEAIIATVPPTADLTCKVPRTCL